MTTTRSGATTSGAAADKAGAGKKHKAEQVSAPPAKSRKKDPGQHEEEEDTKRGETAHQSTKDEGRLEQDDQTTEAETEAEHDAPDSANQGSATQSTAVEPSARDKEPPSNLLEKGIIYFFYRGRVDTDEPQGVEDIARSYIIMRPIEKSAKLGEGPIGDTDDCRLIALPKKTFPQSGRDRWIAFVEKGNTSFEELRKTFLGSTEYETKTAGTRHKPAATPAGEGVYAITSTGRESHLAYMMTLPDHLGEVQGELGLKEKGSFIISTRNPKFPPPKYAQLPKGPEYPHNIMEGFHDLRWIGTTPEHLDIENTQFLLIGQSSGLEKAMQPDEKDQKQMQEEPIEELEKLEDEDTARMSHLGRDDSGAVFADLEAHAKNYPRLATSF